MKIKKKILLLAIGPVLLLGIVTMALTLTMMRGSMLDEIQAALKGTRLRRLRRMTRTPDSMYSLQMATCGREIIMYRNLAVWWTESRKIPAWT